MIEDLLVCIGAQKSGTSWLHSILAKDLRFAQVSQQFTNIKEIHYFDYLYDNKANHINGWRANFLIQMIRNRGQTMHSIIQAYLHGNFYNNLNKYIINGDSFLVNRFNTLTAELNDEWYSNLIKCDKNQTYSLDITPDYSVIGEKGFIHMSKITKNLKIIYILRDPIERAWSGILQDRKGREGGIKAFLEQDNIDMDEIYKEATIGLNVGARTNYKNTIDAIYTSGLQENLKILFYDDITENPEEFIDNIYDFIGMNNDILKTEEYVNDLKKKVYATEDKKSIPKELEQKLYSFYREMLVVLNDTYNIDFPKVWKEKYKLS